MAVPGPTAARIEELERALQVQTKLVETRTRELHQARERSKRQARLVGARTAIALLAQHGTLERAAPQMLEAFGHELEWQVVHLLMLDSATQTMKCRSQWCAGQIRGALALAAHSYPRDVGLPGRVWATAKAQWVSDIENTPNFPGRIVAGDAGLRSVCGFPIVVEGEVHAVIEMYSQEARDVDDDLLVTLSALGSQIGQWIQQSRTQDQLKFNETQIARHIQTAILPRDLAVDGLEVAAMMVPATEVGGDYYDVLPFDGGAWFGIGDVTGHGVGAGMVMLMVQSAVAALTRHPARKSPREVVLELNTFLHDNIRRRLREDDHVTFTLLRYTSDGVVKFAGAHEDILVWRAATQRCERIETKGVWLGAVPAIADVTHDLQLRLEPGDILVLYTDGITEARHHTSRELLELDRLVRIVEELATPTRSIAQLCDAVVGRVMQWCTNNQLDDISLIMARYHGDDIEYEIVRDQTVMQVDDP